MECHLGWREKEENVKNLLSNFYWFDLCFLLKKKKNHPEYDCGKIIIEIRTTNSSKFNPICKFHFPLYEKST